MSAFFTAATRRPRAPFFCWIVRLACGGAGLASAIAVQPESEAKLEFFERKIRPLLVENCHACHSAETKPSGGLRVDDRQGLLGGGNGGPAVVPGKIWSAQPERAKDF